MNKVLAWMIFIGIVIVVYVIYTVANNLNEEYKNKKTIAYIKDQNERLGFGNDSN